jgi:hypothetical protein
MSRGVQIGSWGARATSRGAPIGSLGAHAASRARRSGRGSALPPRGRCPAPRGQRIPLSQSRQPFEVHWNYWTENMPFPAGAADARRGEGQHPTRAHCAHPRECSSGARDTAACALDASSGARGLINCTRGDAAGARDHVANFGGGKQPSTGAAACGGALHTHTHFYAFTPRIRIATAHLDEYSPRREDAHRAADMASDSHRLQCPHALRTLRNDVISVRKRRSTVLAAPPSAYTNAN